MQTYRGMALAFAVGEADKKIREVGSNNRGPRVEWYQKFDSLPGEGYAWCNSFIDACFAAVGRPLNELYRSAGVELTLSRARQLGWIVSTPEPGDLVIFTWSHIGIVRVVGPTSIETVEGNTGPEPYSSDSRNGGDGVYVRRRARSLVRAYIRVPGAPKPRVLTPAERRAQDEKNARLRRLAEANALLRAKGYWAWLAWSLGEGPWKGRGPRNLAVRPDVPKRIPASWWARRTLFLTRRKVASK